MYQAYSRYASKNERGRQMNRVELIGRLANDIDLKKTNSGLSVCTFTLAVQRNTEDKEADFIDCQAWRQTAEYISKYGKKGQLWAVEGHIQKTSYDTDNGKKYLTQVIAERVVSLNNKREDV